MKQVEDSCFVKLLRHERYVAYKFVTWRPAYVTDQNSITFCSDNYYDKLSFSIASAC